MADIDDAWYRLDKATGTKIPTSRHGKGKRWLARWPDGGRQRKRSFAKRDDAKRFLVQVEADQTRGLYVDPALGRVTVKAYAEQWRSQQLHRAATAEYVERMFKLHVDPVIGHLRLGQVRSSHLKTWVKDRGAVLAPSTLRVVYSYVSAMFARAVIDRLIGISPCVSVDLPEVEHREHLIPTGEQVHALSEALPKRYRAVPLVAAATGLRGGELFGLELEAVDFLHRELHVRQQLTVVSGRKPYLGPPKTKTSRRTVELPEVAGLALARHLEQYPARAVGVRQRVGRADPSGELVARVAGGGPKGRTTAGVRSARLAALLRHLADPRGCQPEDGAARVRPLEPDRDLEHLSRGVAGGR